MRCKKFHDFISWFKQVILPLLKKYKYIRRLMVYDLVVISLLMTLFFLPVLIYGFPKFENASVCYVKCK